MISISVKKLKKINKKNFFGPLNLQRASLDKKMNEKFDEKYKDLAYDDSIKEKEKVKMAISHAFAEIVRKRLNFFEILKYFLLYFCFFIISPFSNFKFF